MLLVYNKDSLIIEGDSISITIRNLEKRLSKIQTACKNYKEYANNWSEPINKLSSFHQVKVYALNNNTIIAWTRRTMACAFIAGINASLLVR